MSYIKKELKKLKAKEARIAKIKEEVKGLNDQELRLLNKYSCVKEEVRDAAGGEIHRRRRGV